MRKRSARHQILEALILGASPELARSKRAWIQSKQPKPGEWVIAVDGGWKTARRMGWGANLWVGDGDSVKPSSLPEALLKLILNPEKDQSDLFFALESARILGVSALRAIGVTGGRRDQEWAALHEMIDWVNHPSSQSVEIHSPDCEYHLITPRAGSYPIRLKRGDLFSVFDVGVKPATRVRLKGAKFPVRLGKFVQPSHGLSNRALSGKVEVSLGQGTLLVMIPRR